MDSPTGPLLSVRGDAQATVAPDFVVLSATLSVSRASKAEALGAAAAAWDAVIADLRTLGGVALAVSTERRPLTWSAQSASTDAEREHDSRTGRFQPTGRMVASVAVVITARDFAALDALGAALAGHESLAVHHADWRVDPDNPGWSEVRAAAVGAAVAKGRDYAAALGGSLHRVEQLADAGLLAGTEPAGPVRMTRAASQFLDGGGGEAPETPSLDPVPQQLTAAVDARFVLTGLVLPDS